MNVKIVWVRPALASDSKFLGRRLSGRIQSIWGVEVDGVLTEDTFTSKRAAKMWADWKYRKVAA